VKFKKIIIPVFAVLLVISIFALSFFDSMMSDADGSTFAMGSPVTVKIYGERNGDEMIEPALETVKLLEKTYLSHSLSGSAISILNKENEIVSNDWFTDYIKKCIGLSDKSERFTLFSGELKELGKIEEGGYVPSDNEILQALENLKGASVKIENNTIITKGGKLDLGALGKGTACDEVIGYLKKHNVENALVTVGGSVGVMGDDSYTIGVRDPFGGQNEYFAILNVTNCFISTSGDYEKFFERDGIRYSHIFDATTGKPVQNDITSVTVVAENGTLSDFLSTAIFAEGIENGMMLANEFGAEVIIVKKDKSVLVSDGIKDKLTINDDSFSVIE
jgi:thiamine biosynthesis lipoprotein